MFVVEIKTVIIFMMISSIYLLAKRKWVKKTFKKDLCENYNIRLFTTGAYSPHQNGICEKNHEMVDKIILKMMEQDPNLKIQDALPAAIFAKNSMQNVYGYSPIQIMFGRMPRLPGAPYNKLPAQQGLSKVENTVRLNKAKKNKIHPQMELFEPQDQVYYRSETSSAYWGISS